jgi:outer membrane protein TolC
MRRRKAQLCAAAASAALAALCGGALAAEGRAEEGAQGAGEPWWLASTDPSLRELVEEALSANHDVAAARERVAAAEALAAQAMAPVFGSVSLDASGNLAPLDSLGFQFRGLSTGGSESGAAGGDVYGTGSAMLGGRLQPDWAGQRVEAARAARWDAAAAAAERETVAASLAVTVAETWYELLAARARLSVIDGQVQAAEDLLALTLARWERGAASALDVLQQRQQLAATLAQRPTALSARELREQQLRVLLARPADEPLPQGLATAAAAAALLPEPPPAPARSGGEASTLLASRPELRSAAAAATAAGARRKSAISSLFPTLSLSAQGGIQARVIEQFDSQWTWGLGAAVSIPLFSGGLRHAAVVQARAAERAATHVLAQRELQLGQQQAAARAQDERQQDRRALVGQQLDAARAAWESARERYAAGLEPYLVVHSALVALQQSELAAIQAQRDLLFARIQLLAALGGAWTRGLGQGASP